MYIVEIRRESDGLAEPLTQFRAWLDSKHIQPSVFRCSLIPGGTLFRLEFKAVSEAEAFARAFAGQVSGGEAASAVAA